MKRSLPQCLVAAAVILGLSFSQARCEEPKAAPDADAITWLEEKPDLPSGAVARIGTARLCPKVPVKVLRFVGKEQLLLSAGDAANEIDHALIQVWNLRNGSETVQIRLPCREILQLQAASNANVALVQVNSDKVLAYNAKSGSQLGTIESARTFSAFAVASDGSYMLSVEEDEIVLRRLPAGNSVATIKLKGGGRVAGGVTISRGNKQAAVRIGTDILNLELSFPRIKLLQTFTHKDRHFDRLMPAADRVLAIEESSICNLNGEEIARVQRPNFPDKEVLNLECSGDGYICLRGAWGSHEVCSADRNGRISTAFSIRLPLGPGSISAISSHSGFVAIADRLAPLQVFMRQNESIKRLTSDAISLAGKAIFDESNGKIIGNASTGTVWEWSANNGKPVRELLARSGHDFRFIANSKYVAIRGQSLYVGTPAAEKPSWRSVGSARLIESSLCGRFYLRGLGNELFVERLNGGHADCWLRPYLPIKLSDRIRSTIPAISGRYAVVAVNSGKMYMVDYQAEEPPVELPIKFGRNEDVREPIAFWPSSNRLLYIAHDNYLTSRDLKSGSVYFADKLTDDVRKMLISSGGNYVALAEGDRCVVRDSYSGKEVWRIPGDVPCQYPICFTRDSCRLLTSNVNGLAYAWDWADQLRKDKKPKDRLAAEPLLLYSDDPIEAAIAMRELCSRTSTVDLAATFSTSSDDQDIVKVANAIGRPDSPDVLEIYRRLETCSDKEFEKLRTEVRMAKNAESRYSIERAIRRTEASRGIQRLIHVLTVRNVREPLRRLYDADRNSFARLLAKDALDRLHAIDEGREKWGKTDAPANR